VEQFSTKQRLGILVTGVVQGVGFRPFVYNLAMSNKLTGFVRNEGGLVRLELEGEKSAIEAFIQELKSNPPPLAKISGLDTFQMVRNHDKAFAILESASSDLSSKYVPADAATCADCLAELFDPADPRFRYPFTNCTNCGPRFTIIEKLPYDRPCTTMSAFEMCPACRSEYDDPSNRRFHAQPNACPRCGPRLRFYRPGPAGLPEDVLFHGEALAAVIESIKKGQIAAVKGLGGFHLVCDAGNEGAVETLRARKRRSSKAFAVMMADLEMVRRYCELSVEEQQLLLSKQRPITLLKRKNSLLPRNLAPDVDTLGVMLPYTPLHHLILADVDQPVVATSANLSEEPIAIDNDEALSRLVRVADCFLDHDRRIFSRYDDSVLQVTRNESSFLRRSRGYAPDAITVPFSSNKTVLALGPHLKNTFAFVCDNRAYVSQHIGDLENIETNNHFRQSLETYMNLFDLSPDLIAYDLHPDYFTSSLVSELQEKWKLPAIPVQHHHAHIVSCMVDHGLQTPVLGVAFDGIGYGTDESLWGGEFLYCKYDHFDRLGHFDTFLLPGGTQALKQPWRIALGIIVGLPAGTQELFAPFLKDLEAQYGKRDVSIVRQQIRAQFNSPLSSSCGRVFDAISALVGVCYQTDYEAQAAIRLQRKARACNHASLNECLSESYSFSLTRDGPIKIQIRDIFIEAYQDLQEGGKVEDISCKFHSTMAHIVSQTCILLRDKTKVDRVCLSGGVFQNEVLLEMCDRLLAANEFQCYWPQQLPANDGGISLGQAVVALAKTGSLIR
jgi:hydrogenase maturation protein HypF